jgi:hypothetical protein
MENGTTKKRRSNDKFTETKNKSEGGFKFLNVAWFVGVKLLRRDVV